MKRLLARALLLAAVAIAVPVCTAQAADAVTPAAAVSVAPAAPGDPLTTTKTVTPAAPSEPGSVNIRVDKLGNKPSQPVVIILLLTVMAVEGGEVLITVSGATRTRRCDSGTELR